MRRSSLLAILLVLVLVACEKEQISSGKGFSMKIGDREVLSANDIDYYDLSTHFIYLKGDNTFVDNKLPTDSFSIFADGIKIYSGSFFSVFMSSLPIGHYITSPVLFYSDYVVPLGFGSNIDRAGKAITDLRGDARIQKALKTYGQLHEGLKCEISSLKITAGSKDVTLELKLTNNDTFNYYYPDPEKMGLALYHYFTNGLLLYSSGYQKSFSNNIQHIAPTASEKPNYSWLSPIRSGEKKTISIHYTNFDPVPAGQYKLYFSLPGSSQVEKSKIVQGSGRVWLGELKIVETVQVK